AGAQGPERESKKLALERCDEGCEQLAPALRLYKRLMGCDDEHPAVWLELVQDCAKKAEQATSPQPEVVKAGRLTPKALKDDQGITVALRKVQVVLEA